MEVLDSIEDINDRWTFMQWISAYALNGEELPIPAFLKPLAAMFRASIDESNEKYDAAIEQRKVAAARRWGKKIEKSTDNDANGCETMRTDAAAYSAMRNDANDAVSVSVSDSVSVDSSDKSSESNNPPKAPQGAKDAADAAVEELSFEDYMGKVEEAQCAIPTGLVPAYERQWVWRKADGMKLCCETARQLVAKCRGDTVMLDNSLHRLWEDNQPFTPFQKFLTAIAALKLDAEARKKVAAYIDKQEPPDMDFWKIMQDKIAYIKDHRKEIHSIPALLAARKKK